MNGAEPVRRPRRPRPLLPALLLAAVALPGLAMPAPVQAQAEAESRFERRAAGEATLDTRVQFAAGTLRIRPLRSSGLLYSAALQYDEEVFRPLHRFEDGHLVVGTEGTGRTRTMRRDDTGARLELALPRTTPTELHLELGATRSELELGGVALSSLHIKSGAADTRISVSERNPEEMDRIRVEVGAASLRGSGLGRLRASRWVVDAGVGDVRLEFQGLERAETHVTARVGLGALDIRVPDEAGIRVTRSTLLSGFNTPGLVRDGDAWVSTNWADAEIRIQIHVDAAFGSVMIRPESFGDPSP